MQLDALEEVGCTQIFTDQGISGTTDKRPGLSQALACLQEGDVLVVWKLDRAFRSLRHALDILEEFEKRNIEFRSLTDQIDTTTAMGKCMYQVRTAFAELERNLISERTRAGMQAARRRGAKLGRPRKLTDAQIEWAQKQLQQSPSPTIKSLAKTLNVSPKTLRRVLQ